MTRKPATPEYDVVVGLEPKEKGQSPSFAYALAKFTYDLTPAGLVATQSEPLQFDVYGDETLSPRLPPGSDYWVTKRATDVVIVGSACSPEAQPTTYLDVSATVADRMKRIAVFGRREIHWRAGAIEIGDPEPFSAMPLLYSNAYGGLDPRVPIPEEDREQYMRYASVGQAVDHPGLYPRNPIGKGYVVYQDPLPGLEMPNLEDPYDLLTRERLITGDPQLWYRQPLPWCFDWTSWLMYPRELYVGFDAWYPCPDPALLAEVQRAFLLPLSAAPAGQRIVPPDEMYQEASLGMIFRTALAGAPVLVSGMNPERPVSSFVVPPDPLIEIEIEGSRSLCPTVLTNLVIRPTDNKVHAVWLAKTAGLPRAFVPEVHKNIPLSVSVNRGRSIRYESPPTVRERLAAAQAEPRNIP